MIKALIIIIIILAVGYAMYLLMLDRQKSKIIRDLTAEQTRAKIREMEILVQAESDPEKRQRYENMISELKSTLNGNP